MVESYTYVIENCAIADPITVYVGKANDPALRWKQHIQEMNDSRLRFQRSHFSNALRKYGISNFKLHIAEICNSELDAFNKEAEWIAYFKSMGVKVYNKTLGGYGGERRATSDEIKAKQSQAHRRRYQSLDLRRQISQKLLGHVKSAETRKRLSAAKEIPVAQLDYDTGTLIQIFDSAIKAEIATNVHRSKICMVCKNQRKKAGGFGWRYHK